MVEGDSFRQQNFVLEETDILFKEIQASWCCESASSLSSVGLQDVLKDKQNIRTRVILPLLPSIVVSMSINPSLQWINEVALVPWKNLT